MKVSLWHWESPREKQFKILRHAAMLWLILQSMHGCLVREENCRYLVQSIKIVGINCHSQPEPWTCLFMSHSAEIEKKKIKTAMQREASEMFSVKQQLMENAAKKDRLISSFQKGWRLRFKWFRFLIWPTLRPLNSNAIVFRMCLMF